MAIARNQAALSVLYVGQRAKAVILQLEDPFRSAEGARLRGNGQCVTDRKHQLRRVANGNTKKGEGWIGYILSATKKPQTFQSFGAEAVMLW